MSSAKEIKSQVSVGKYYKNSNYTYFAGFFSEWSIFKGGWYFIVNYSFWGLWMDFFGSSWNIFSTLLVISHIDIDKWIGKWITSSILRILLRGWENIENWGLWLNSLHRNNVNFWPHGRGSMPSINMSLPFTSFFIK